MRKDTLQFLTLTCAALLAQAASGASNSYVYTHDSRELFEIVVNRDPEAKREPGIYKIHAKTGELVPLIEGHPVGVNRSFKGVLAYADTSQSGGTNDILSVIDGKLMLLNFNSSPKNGGSYLQFGSNGKSAVPLVDILNGTHVQLPPIHDIDDIKIYESQVVPPSSIFPKGAKLFIASVKAGSILGKGITFGFIVESRSGTEKVSVHKNQAVVLAYDFMDENAMSRLSLPSGGNLAPELASALAVYSPLLIQNTQVNLPKDNSFPTANHWNRQLTRYLSYIFKGRAEANSQDRSLRVGIPLYDFISGKMIYPDLPLEHISEHSTTFAQVYDPFARRVKMVDLSQLSNPGAVQSVQLGATQLLMLKTDKIDEITVSAQEVDRNPKNGKFFLYGESSVSNPHQENANITILASDNFLFFSKGQLHLAVRQTKSGSVMQILPLEEFRAEPGDRIEFIKLKIFHVGNRLIQTYLISRQGKRSGKSQVYSLILEDTGTLRVLQRGLVHEGPFISPTELALRTQYTEYGPVFDHLSPVLGPGSYRKETGAPKGFKLPKNDGVVKKTVPYLRLFHDLSFYAAHDQIKYEYLVALTERPLIVNQLYFKEYDQRNSPTAATGFYLFKPDSGTNALPLNFVPGYPLFSRKDNNTNNTNHIVDSSFLSFPSSHSSTIMPVKVSLIPLLTQMPKIKDGVKVTPKNFKMAVSFTAENIPGNNSGINGVMHHVDIGLPYGSLAYTKIIQGIKNKSEQFHILLYFREDSKVPGSQNGVMVINGTISRSDLTNRVISVNLSEPMPLSRAVVGRSDYRSHLKLDAEGAYYWDEDPSIGFDSAKKRIRKLTEPDMLVASRSSGILSLREAVHLENSEIGVTNRVGERGGAWEIYTKENLKSRVSGLSEAFEEYEKKHARKTSYGDEGQEVRAPKEQASEYKLLEAFETYLDRLVNAPADENDKIRVVIVEPALREKFRFALFQKLVKSPLRKAGSANATRFELNAPKFRFFYAQQDLDDVETAEELRFISADSKDKKNILYVEPALLKGANIVSRAELDENQTEAEETDDYGDVKFSGKTVDPKTIFKYDNVESPASMATLLASGGLAKTVQGWKRVKNNSRPVPAIVISTPHEWREITTHDSNHKEYEGGIYDSFELNHDFLTSTWTMWPPGTERAPDDIKALTKNLYNGDEMRVFPTLNAILEKAANGEMKGSQTILIVPPELKPIIQKLSLLRWATPDLQSAGAWSHANPQLALFRITSQNVSQASIQDNFRAVAGSSLSRNAVVISDLETIERMGRPVNQGRNFSLRDPVRVVRDILDDQGEPSAPPQQEFPEIANEANANRPETLDLEYADLQARLDEYNKQIEERNMAISEIIQTARNRGYRVEEYHDRLAMHDNELRSLIRDRDEISELISQKQPPSQPEQSSAGVRNFPHALWWIAAEGQTIQPRRAKSWSLKTAVDRHAATILIGTEEELMQLEGSLGTEAKYFSLRDHFDIVHLSPPNEETRFKLLQTLFEKENVRALGLEFKLNEGNERDPQSQLIYHFVNRVEQIAYDIKMEKTTAFVKAFTALKNALTEDLDLRRNRQFDVRFIERLFTKVFPMPLNVDILEPQDPLAQLQNVDNAVRNLTKSGYEGSQDLKRRFIENILSQTRPTDPSRPIPNSQILFSKTSIGKTFLIQTLMKSLAMVEYNPNKPSNADADYIFVKVANLTHNETADPGKVPVTKVIEWIYDLLAQPKGARATIIFDDFHKAISVEVRKALFQFIQGLFEANNGMITVHSRDGKKAREIPVQNLNLYMTINPASSEKARGEFIRPNKSYNQAELLKLEVLAAIADNGFKPEESVLARWSDIINIDNFPRSAKVPELGRRIRRHGGGDGFILVDPTVIDRFVSRFDGANARELLSPAASALTSIPSNARDSKIYLVSLRDENEIPPNYPTSLIAADGSQVNLQELQATVRKLTQIDAIRLDEPKSMLRYMAFIMQNFRLQVFNSLAVNAHMSDTLRLNRPGMINVLKMNFLMGISTHVLQNPQLPQGEMVVRPEQLRYFNRVQTDEFYSDFVKTKSQKQYFPPKFAQQTATDLSLENFVSGVSSQQVPPRTRRELLHTYVQRIDNVLLKFMRLYLRLDPGLSIPELARWNEAQVTAWFGQLPEANPDAEAGKIVEEILELFLAFQEDFNSDVLVDLDAGGRPSTIYDEVRLFGYLIDKAIANMPWGTISKFTYDVAQLSSDFRLGTKTAFKEYVGTHELSPFSSATPEFMSDILNVSKSMTHAPPQSPEVLKESFAQFCDALLRGGQ